MKRPVETSQARGLAGTPSRGHCSTRGGERVVQRLLGEIEIAEQADQGGEHAARLGAVDGVHRRPRLFDRVLAPQLRPRRDQLNVMIGRTSMLPVFADGIRDATWIASLRSFASIR